LPMIIEVMPAYIIGTVPRAIRAFPIPKNTPPMRTEFRKPSLRSAIHPPTRGLK
jgi:hypothetical protein